MNWPVWPSPSFMLTLAPLSNKYWTIVRACELSPWHANISGVLPGKQIILTLPKRETFWTFQIWKILWLTNQPFPKQALVFMCLQYKSFENTVGKGEIAHNEQFLLFPQCFLPFWRTFNHFHQVLNCFLQTLSVWKSLMFIIWARVKSNPNYKTDLW